MKKPRPSQIERTAFHEAGHAVVAILLNTGFRLVTTIPDKQRGLLGLSLSGRLCQRGSSTALDLELCEPNCSPRVQSLVQRRLVEFMAGYAAEFHFSKRRNKVGAGRDFQDAVNLAGRISFGDAETVSLVEWALNRATGMLTSSYRWKGVEALANALLERKTLKRAETKRVFWDALRKGAGLQF